MDNKRTATFVKKEWIDNVLPSLMDFIRIPNLSPAFDAAWDSNGHQLKAFDLVTRWAKAQKLDNCKIELIKDEGRTPLLIMEIEPHQSEQSCMLYAHIDKQPPMGAWKEGLGPCKPVIKDGKLYGRGAVDDGYGFFSAVTSIKAIQEQGLPCPRIVMLFEGCEESGSRDLPHYMDKLSERVGTPDLIVCLDAGAGNYEQLWVTTSLRGVTNVMLNVQMMTDGAHSGTSSGIVPSSFRITRQLLSRVEDEVTGLVKPEQFYVKIPPSRLEQVKAAADILGDTVTQQFPFVEGAHPVAKDGPVSEHILAKSWRPALSVTGCDGLPATAVAGNVMLPFTKLKLSLRLPPTLDAAQASLDLERILTKDPPQGARVTVERSQAGNGWHAPLEAAWLSEAVHRASLTFFDRPCAHLGEGGSIPFMGMLLDMFPRAQFLVTGAAGPGNCMHAPNENLHIDYSARLTMCVSQVIATLATTKIGAEAPPAKKARSFVDAFQLSGGNSRFFVGCDCGTAGCVIFDQGKEPVCPPAIRRQRP
jgi:acetylornithine deacetylase/succinyl-diaminopimelate desuccinylase-like protein